MAKVKVTAGQIPQDNLIRAKLPVTAETGQLSMPSRFMLEIDAGLEVKVQSGYRLRLDIVPELTEQGMVLIHNPLTQGKVKLILLNVGRNIVVLKENDPVATPWLEREIKMEWE